MTAHPRPQAPGNKDKNKDLIPQGKDYGVC